MSTQFQKPIIILITTRQVFSPLLAGDKKLNPRLMYKLVKFINASAQEEQFYGEQFRAIFNEFALKNEDGSFAQTDNKQGIRINPDRAQEFQKAIFELDMTEVDVPNIGFTLDELEAIGINEISGKEMAALMEFMEGEEE